MTLHNERFENLSSTLDTSISAFVTLGEHDSNGKPIPDHSLAFGSFSDGAILSGSAQTGYNRLTMYPYLKDNFRISKSFDIENRRYLISNVTISLVEGKVRAGGLYSSLSTILYSEFPNSNLNARKSVLNSTAVIWFAGVSRSMNFNHTLPIFRGYVSDMSLDKNIITLKLEDHMSKVVNREIPSFQMPSELTGEIEENGFRYGITEDQLNRPVPITLGNVKHSETIKYHDMATELFLENSNSYGYEFKYLANDRVGQMFPNTNIYLLDHNSSNDNTFARMDVGLDLGNNKDMISSATSCNMWDDTTWRDIRDIYNVWVGDRFYPERSFYTLDSGEIRLVSSWMMDNDLQMLVPSTTFANETLYYFHRAAMKDGAYMTGFDISNWYGWQDTAEEFSNNFFGADVTASIVQSFEAISGQIWWNEEYEDGYGTFDPNDGVILSGADFNAWGVFAVETPALWFGKLHDVLSSNFLTTQYETTFLRGIVSANTNNDELDTIDFEDWIVMYHYDVAVRTASDSQKAESQVMFQDSSGTFIVPADNCSANIRFSTIFYDYGLGESESYSPDDNLFEGSDAIFSQSGDFVHEHNSWRIAGDAGLDPAATDWVRIRGNVKIGEKGSDAFGIPKGMSLYMTGFQIGTGGWYQSDGTQSTGMENFIISDDFGGACQIRVYDFVIAYLFGVSNAYNKLKISSRGRGTGLNANGDINNPNNSSVVSIAGSDNPVDNPVSMIAHLMEKELGIDFGGNFPTSTKNAHDQHHNGTLGTDLGHDKDNWELNLNLKDRTQFKQVMEDIAKSSNSIPMVVTGKDGNADLEFFSFKESFSSISTPTIPTYGCTYNFEGISNYDVNAMVNDGSCLNVDGEPAIIGCTDNELGLNPDIFGHCISFTPPFNNHDDDGNILNPSLEWAHGLCVTGPTDIRSFDYMYGYNASNHNIYANIDDNSCHYELVGGCSDPSAFNYDENADYNDDSCSYEAGTPLECLKINHQIVTVYYPDGASPDESGELNDFFPYSISGTDIGNNYNGHYSIHVIEMIKQHVSGVIMNTLNKFFAKDMNEWLFFHEFDQSNYCNGELGSFDFMLPLALLSYQVEIYARKAALAGGDNHYHSVITLYGYVPKSTDYMGNESFLLSQSVWDSYPWIGFDYDIPFCPGWGGIQDSHDNWDAFIRYLVDTGFDDGEEVDWLGQPGIGLTWPPSGNSPRTLLDIADVEISSDIDDCDELYEFLGLWNTHCQANSFNVFGGGTILEWFEENLPSGVDFCKFMILMANTGEATSLTADFLGVSTSSMPDYYESDGTISAYHLYLSAMSHYNVSSGFADSGYRGVPWLEISQEDYYNGQGGFTNCWFNGLDILANNNFGYDIWAYFETSPSSGAALDVTRVIPITTASGNSIECKSFVITPNSNGYANLLTNGSAELGGLDYSTTEISLNKHTRNLVYFFSSATNGVHSNGQEFRNYDWRSTNQNDPLSSSDPMWDYILDNNSTRVPIGIVNAWGFRNGDESNWHIAPHGNILHDYSIYGEGINRYNSRISTSTTASFRADSSIDTIIKADEIIKCKIYQSNPKKIVSRVKVKFDYNEEASSYSQETDWEYWSDMNGIKGTYYLLNGEYPTGEEILDYYSLERQGYDEDGTPNIYAASSKIIECKNTSDIETAEKIRRSYLGMHMNQKIKMDLTLPLRYTTLELGDYVAFDKLIEGKKAYGEDYSLESYIKTKSIENPDGIFESRIGQVVYPIFLIEKIEYSLRGIRVVLEQAHDWTGEKTTSFFEPIEDEIIDIEGCTDPTAMNWNPQATIDDGTCQYVDGSIDIIGCTDPLADNFNPEAVISCENCCEYPEIEGCMDSNAANYNPDATLDDGSCWYLDPMEGCMNPLALNYNPMATLPCDACCQYPTNEQIEAGIAPIGTFITQDGGFFGGPPGAVKNSFGGSEDVLIENPYQSQDYPWTHFRENQTGAASKTIFFVQISADHFYQMNWANMNYLVYRVEDLIRQQVVKEITVNPDGPGAEVDLVQRILRDDGIEENIIDGSLLPSYSQNCVFTIDDPGLYRVTVDVTAHSGGGVEEHFLTDLCVFSQSNYNLEEIVNSQEFNQLYLGESYYMDLMQSGNVYQWIAGGFTIYGVDVLDIVEMTGTILGNNNNSTDARNYSSIELAGYPAENYDTMFSNINYTLKSEVGDGNFDGAINVLDVMKKVNIVLGIYDWITFDD